MVTNIGNKAIHYIVNMHNQFLILQNEIEKEVEACEYFLDLYNRACPKLKSVMKLFTEVWEQELALPKEDH